MLQIKLHTHWLDIDSQTTIQWEIENPLFTQGELLGDVSGNFSVPATPNNATAFSYAHIISHYTNGQPQYSGEVWVEGIRIFIVTITVESCTNTRYNLHMVSKAVTDLANKTLQDIDWQDEPSIEPPTANADTYPTYTHCYPVVQNAKFFSFQDDPNFIALSNTINDGDYARYMNVPYDDSFALITPSAVVPMFYLMHILKKFFEGINYTLQATWDSELLSLFIYNNQSIRDYTIVLGTPFSFFGIPATVNPKSHVPKENIANILTDLEAKFGIKAYINTIAQTIVLKFAKDIIQSTYYINVDDWMITRDYKITWEDETQVDRCYAPDELDDFCTEPKKVLPPNVVTATVDKWQILPPANTVAATDIYFVTNINAYAQAKTQETPPGSGTYVKEWRILTHNDFCLEVGSNDSIESSTPLLMDYGVVPTFTNDSWITPRVEQLGGEILYFDPALIDVEYGWYHPFNYRLSFYRGLRQTYANNHPDYALANYAPYDAAGNNIGNYSLDYNDATYGLYEKWLKPYYQFLQNTKIVERSMRLTITDLLNLDLSKKVAINEIDSLQLYLIKTIKIVLRHDGIQPATVTLCKTY